jgi:hypothetical protein
MTGYQMSTALSPVRAEQKACAALTGLSYPNCNPGLRPLCGLRPGLCCFALSALNQKLCGIRRLAGVLTSCDLLPAVFDSVFSHVSDSFNFVNFAVSDLENMSGRQIEWAIGVLPLGDSGHADDLHHFGFSVMAKD